VTETESVYCAVRTGILRVGQLKSGLNSLQSVTAAAQNAVHIVVMNIAGCPYNVLFTTVSCCFHPKLIDTHAVYH